MNATCSATGLSVDAAIHKGLKLLFNSKYGMCCTCNTKLLQGEVEMEVHYGLEHDEIEAGYILTCQSHPKTAVVVDYDARQILCNVTPRCMRRNMDRVKNATGRYHYPFARRYWAGQSISAPSSLAACNGK